MMKAVLCTQFGGPEKLVVDEIEAADPGPDEVRIKVRAVGLNFFDTLIIENKYQFKPELPFSPGAELAGEIVDAGKDVKEFAPGQRVMAYSAWGAAREEVVIPASAVIAMPDDLPFEVAAGLIVTYGTSLHALKDRAHLQAGESLAVLGAAGGVGQAAVEIGKAMGARVIACASSDDKLAFCSSLGADETVNYADEDIKARLKALTAGAGVDVIYDPVGAELAEPALRAIGWKGRFLVIGFAGGQIPKIPLNLALLKGCQIVGVFWGAHLEREPEVHRANMAQLLAWVGEGKVKPHVHKIYALDETSDALNALARREVRGKAIVVP